MLGHSILDVPWPVFVYMRIPQELSKDLPFWVGRGPLEDDGNTLGPNVLDNSGQVSVTGLMSDLALAGRFPQRDRVVLRPWFKTGQFRLEIPFRKISSRHLRLPEHHTSQLEPLFTDFTWVVKAGENKGTGCAPERFYISLTRPTKWAAPQSALWIRDGWFVLAST